MTGLREGLVAETESDQIPVAQPGRRGATWLREYGVVISFAVLFATLALTSDAFLTKTNLLNILDQNAGIGIIACSLTLVLIVGQLDFSGAAIYGLAGVTAAGLVDNVGAWPAIAIAIGVGVGLGLINGYLVSYWSIDSFVCTLATGIMISGFTLLITKGEIISSTDETFAKVGNETLFGVTWVTWIFLAVAILLTLLLTRTFVGQQMFAVGDNLEASRLAGLRTRVITMMTFAIAGTGAGIAGVLIASRTTAGQPQAGLELVVTALAGIVVGGTSVSGGRGAIWRTVLGILFLALIGNGLNLLDVDTIYQQIIQGAIILTAVVVDRFSRGTG